MRPATTSTRWLPAVVSAATVVVALAFALLNLVNVPTVQASDVGESALLVAVTITMTLLGTLIVRRTANPIGWIFLVMALAAAISGAGEAYIYAAFRPHPRDLPALGFVGWVTNAVNPMIVAPVPALLLLFPTGRPSSSRWRWALRLWLLGLAAVVAWGALHSGHYGAPPAEGLPGIDVDYSGAALPAPFAEFLAYLSIIALIASGLLGVLSLVLRYRRAEGDERLQLRWLTFVASIVAADLALSFVLPLIGLTDAGLVGDILWIALVLLVVVGVPAAVAVAILKYRLYDVDVVINKAVVYSSLAVFITLVYVGLVVGVGTVLRAGDEPNVALQIAATAVVAVAFQPVRERAQRFANRVVYGRRASPYEVLSGIARRAGETYATDEVLQRMAKVIAEGTGASRVDVWVRSGDELVADAAWPVDGVRERIRIDDGSLPDVQGVAHAVEVRYQGDLLGAVTVAKPRGEALTGAETNLLDDLASHAGLVLRNVGLTKELLRRLGKMEAQAAALNASRHRIVAAQDSERRRLERNIHDGAQQHLVALAVKLRLARSLAATKQPKAREILDDLQVQLGVALDTLIDLARGIYPPLLEEHGLAAALAAQYMRGPLSVTLSGGGVRRYPIEVEAAAYFCILEALQNATKYSNANHVRIELDDAPHELAFKVIDDGIGFDPAEHANGTGVEGMSDRVGALGGDLAIDSSPGRGTTVTGRIPVVEPEPA